MNVASGSKKPEQVLEAGAFAFDTYAVTVHEATREAKAPVEADHAGQRALASYEADMLLHAYRGEPPFRTHVVRDLDEVTIHFAPTVEFQSEGHDKLLVSPGHPNGRDVNAFVTGVQTYFPRSRISILHIVFSGTGSPGQGMSEYELIKLAKLWEGGEGFPEPGAGSTRPACVSFSSRGEVRMDFDDFVRTVFRDTWSDNADEGQATGTARSARSRVYRTGTIEVESPLSPDQNELLLDIVSLQSGGTSLPPMLGDSDRWKRLVAIGGLLQGLLDFKEIDQTELSDVFKEVKLEGRRLIGVHKGTLLSVELPSEEEDPESGDAAAGEDRVAPIPADPYFVIPHAVVLHNEERLKNALAMGLELPAGQLDVLGPQVRDLNAWQRLEAATHRPIRLNEKPRKLERDDRLQRMVGATGKGGRLRFRDRAFMTALKAAASGHVEELGDHRLVGPLSIKNTITGLRDASDVFAHRLPNVFHYSNERWIFEQGHGARGFAEFQSVVQLRLEEIGKDVDSRVKRRDASTIVLAITFPVLSALQAAVSETTEWVPAWIFPIAAVIVILALILWRIRI